MYTSKKTSSKERLEKLQNNMWSQVQSFMEDPKKLLEYTRFLKHFPQYSVHNRMMIASQRMSAVAVAGFNFYKAKGIHVKKGSKAIKIMIPSTFKCFLRTSKSGEMYKVAVSKANAEEKQAIKNNKIKVYESQHYYLGSVFDVTQTDLPKEKYPEVFPNLHVNYQVSNDYDHNSVIEGVHAILTQLGVTLQTVSYEKWEKFRLGNAKGVFVPSQQIIMLNPQNSDSENDAVLLHELSHAIMHSQELNSVQKQLKLQHHDKLKTCEQELEAEMTAYLVCNGIGIDTTSETTKYIASWTKKGNAINKDCLAVFFDEIVKVADFISQNINKCEMAA